MTGLTLKKQNKIHRIDAAVSLYFEEHPLLEQVQAKALMQHFIQLGIFLRDYDNGYPIRHFLGQLKRSNRLNLLKECKAVQHTNERNWYFKRIE